jgi:hypothetical protein
MVRLASIARAAAVAACAAVAVGAQAYDAGYDIYAKPGERIEIAPGRTMNLRCSGAGDVAAILESGLGYPSYSWRKVQPALARVTRVCSYDRAGLGFSDPGLLPRIAGAIADDLKLLLDKAGVRLGRRYDLKIVNGASHDLLSDYVEVRRLIEAWLDRYLMKR